MVKEGDLRLSSNSSLTGNNEGRLEIYHNGEWGSICDDLFGYVDGNVACRQLGFARLTKISVGSDYGKYT